MNTLDCGRRTSPSDRLTTPAGQGERAWFCADPGRGAFEEWRRAEPLRVLGQVPEMAKLRPNSGWPKFHPTYCRLNLEVGWEGRPALESITTVMPVGGFRF